MENIIFLGGFIIKIKEKIQNFVEDYGDLIAYAGCAVGGILVAAGILGAFHTGAIYGVSIANAQLIQDSYANPDLTVKDFLKNYKVID